MIAESIAKSLNCTVCVTDNDQIVAVVGNGKKELQDKYISTEIEKILRMRKHYLAVNEKGRVIPIVEGTEEFKDQVICPIICEGDVIGGIVLLEKETNKFQKVEEKVAAMAADFLGRQMGQ